MPKPGIEILYHPLVVKKDIPRLSASIAKRVRHTIETKLSFRPEVFGLPLRGTLKKYWKLRIGDYRVVYEIRDKQVFVLVIANRKDVYELATKR
jgi:mRNA interferase RelE/StbE